MKCNNCGYENVKLNQKTCPCCGVSLTAVASTPQSEVQTSQQQRECPECHQFLPERANFCPYCGHSFLKTESSPIQQEVLESTPEPVLEPELQPEPPSTPSAVYGKTPAYEPEPDPEPAPTPFIPDRKSRLPKKRRGSYKELNYDNIDEEKPTPFVRQESKTEPVGTYDRRSGEVVFQYDDDEPRNDTSTDFASESYPEPAPSSQSSWLMMAAIAIVSILVGTLLYIVTQS